MNAPTCPNTACGAKFQHDRQAEKCKQCGLPDEIAEQGPQAIAHWVRRGRVRAGVQLSKREFKEKPVIGGSAGRRRKKHGMRRAS